MQGGISKVEIKGDGTTVWGSAADFGRLTWDTGKAILQAQSGKALSLGANNLSDHVYINTSGNVGIGTTNLTYKLHVANGDVLANQDVAKVSLGAQVASGDVHFGSSGLAAPSTGSQDYGFYAAHNAYRDSTGAWKHSRTLTIPAVRLLGSGGVSSGNSGFSFDYSANTGTGSLTWTNLMQITTAGNVGIGTTSPNAKLDISGSLNISGSGTQVPLQVSSGSTSLLFVSSSGNVGIGTTTPNAKLNVNGNTIITGSLAISASIFQYSNNASITSGSTANIASFLTSSFTAGFFDFVATSGTNARAGTVFTVWNANNVEYAETSTNDIGNTTNLLLSASLSAGAIRLQGTSLSGSWSVKTLTRMI
jgi:hypothetical protein